MHAVIEIPTFLRTAKAFWSDGDIAEFVGFIARHPLTGDVMHGTKSLRKVRRARPGMGKSGGARVIYFCTSRCGRSGGGLCQGRCRQAAYRVFEQNEGIV